MSDRGPKRPRTSRTIVRTGLNITCRDIFLLSMVGLMGYVSTEQVAREFFPSQDRARRRLRLLFDKGFICISVIGSTKPNLVSLTKTGLRLASETSPDLADRLRLAGPIRLAEVERHLLLVDVRLYAAALGELRNEPLVRWSSADSVLGREFGLHEFHLEPDSLAEFATNQGRVCVAVKLDTGTELAWSGLSRKLGRYREAAKAGCLDNLWCVVKGGREKQETIQKRLREEGLEEFGQALTHELVICRPVREPVTRDEKRAEGPTTLFTHAQERLVNRSV